MNKSGAGSLRTVVFLVLLVLLAGQLVWHALSQFVPPGSSMAETPDYVLDLRGRTLPTADFDQLTAVAGASLADQLAAPTVVVAFLHPSCPACLAARQALEQVVADGGGQVGFIGVFSGSMAGIEEYTGTLPGFVDEGRGLFNKLGVLSVPTFVVARDGEVTFQSVGWSDDIARELALAARVDLTGQGIERQAEGTRGT